MVLSINSMKPIILVINGFHKVRSFPFTLSVTIYWKEPLYFFDEFSATVSSFCSLCHRIFIWPPFWSYTCWLNCDNPRNLEKSIKTSRLFVAPGELAGLLHIWVNISKVYGFLFFVTRITVAICVGCLL